MSAEDEFDLIGRFVVIYSWVVYGVLLQIINVFGIVTNIINIICFAKQGFDDSVNISLLGLSVSDLASLMTMVWTALCLSPAVMAADLSFDPLEIGYLTSGMAHFSFTRVSSCITAMITLERCLCITSPLKIKSIITPRRVTVITVGVFIVFFCSGSPVWAVNRLGLKYFPSRNKTMVGIISTAKRENVEMLTFAINNFFIPFGAFIIIVVCTSILSFQLRIKGKWRQETAKSKQGEIVSNRNQRAAKMVVIISTLFIICFVPVSMIMLAVGFIPELSFSGRYVYVSVVLAGLGYIMESINSSMNIFIYYCMSSKYRNMISRMFCFDSEIE